MNDFISVIWRAWQTLWLIEVRYFLVVICNCSENTLTELMKHLRSSILLAIGSLSWLKSNDNSSGHYLHYIFPFHLLTYLHSDLFSYWNHKYIRQKCLPIQWYRPYGIIGGEWMPLIPLSWFWTKSLLKFLVCTVLPFVSTSLQNVWGDSDAF